MEIQLNDFTEQSKRCILQAIKKTEEYGFKYLEPQVLMACILSEGRDLMLPISLYLGLDIVALSGRVHQSISAINEFSDNTTGNVPIMVGEEHLFPRQTLSISPQTLAILDGAKELSMESDEGLITLEFLLLALAHYPSVIKDILLDLNIEESNLRDAIAFQPPLEFIEGKRGAPEEVFPNSGLAAFGKNLCAEARMGHIRPAIGRDEEIRRMIHVLARQTKNNPILIGEPGTGKTAIVEGLACRIANGDVPREFRDVEIYSFDIASLISGASYLGDYQQRLKNIIEEVSNSCGKVILFIDEIHQLIGAGRINHEVAMDAANILKPELARGKMKIIGATTIDEYRKYIEQDKAFERRFQKILVEEPDEDAALTILRGIRPRLEEFHKIRITDGAIKAAVKLSMRYIQGRYLPDKAIDLLDEAAAEMKIARSSSPVELDLLQRKIITKEIECESLKRDDATDPSITTIQAEIANLKEEEESLRARWKCERRLLDDIQDLRNEMARLEEEKKVAIKKQGAFSAFVDLALEIKDKQAKIDHLMKVMEGNAGISLLKPALDELDVMSVIAKATGIPVSRLNESEIEKLAHLEEQLSLFVIGQDEAKIAVANAIRRSRLGIGDENKPIGSFLFLGTTGVGKTELCKALGELLFNSRDAIIRVDMSEYQQEKEVSKLFGPPPGIDGNGDGGYLTEAVRLKPYSIILLDEIEKAHPKVFETFLQVLDDGRMTDGKGRTINFKNTIIVMTSNLGQDVIYSTLQGKRYLQRPRIGFSVSDQEDVVVTDDSIVTGEKIEEAKMLVLEDLKSTMAPEFINRIDEIVMFLPLSKDEVRRIASLQIGSFVNKAKQKGFTIIIDESVADFIARIGFQPEYGARPIKRAITNYLVNDLSINIINGSISKDKPIYISSSHDGLTFSN